MGRTAYIVVACAATAIVAAAALSWPSSDDLNDIEQAVVAKLGSLSGKTVTGGGLFGEQWSRYCFEGTDTDDDPALKTALKQPKFRKLFEGERARLRTALVILVARDGIVHPLALPNVVTHRPNGGDLSYCFANPNFTMQVFKSTEVHSTYTLALQR